MGGSILGAESIYYFLKNKIKKIFFYSNLQSKVNINDKKNKYLNLIVSKSGNTLETISNSNIIIKNKDKIFLLQRTKELFALIG